MKQASQNQKDCQLNMDLEIYNFVYFALQTRKAATSRNSHTREVCQAKVCIYTLSLKIKRHFKLCQNIFNYLCSDLCLNDVNLPIFPCLHHPRSERWLPAETGQLPARQLQESKPKQLLSSKRVDFSFSPRGVRSITQPELSLILSKRFPSALNLLNVTTAA